jgi:endo-1,4-beta-mannosidase
VDELDGILGYTPGSAHPWLQALAGYLREIDPYDHLITAGTRQLEPAIWETLDFAQVRCYQDMPSEETVDQVADTLIALSEASAYARKPVLLTEFSLNRWHEPAADDPTGVHIHNTIWATALSGAAGGGMTWWWDTYVDRQNLYTVTPPGLFCATFPGAPPISSR